MSDNSLLQSLGFTNGQPVLQEKPVQVIRAAVYTRVSTDDQADPVKGSLDEQLKKCLSTISKNGWENTNLHYEDIQKGHRAEIRDGLMQMLEDSANDLFDVLVVYDADRFSRNRDTAVSVRQKLKKHFIQVYSCNQPRELKNPAEYDPDQDDSEVIHEAIVDIKADVDVKGLRRKVRNGAKNRALKGEPHDVPYGYDKKYLKIHPSVELDVTINSQQGEIIKRIFELFLKKDSSYRKICTVLNTEKTPSPMGRLWTPASIKKILQNPFYIGFVRHNHRPVFRGKRKQTPPEEWILTFSTKIPKLIDEESFKQVQERIKKRYVLHGRAVASEGLLVGLVYCNCGHKLYYKRRNVTPSLRERSPNAGDRWYYYCACNRARGVRVCPCNIYKISAAKLDSIVVGRIRELTQNSTLQGEFEKITFDKLVDNLQYQIEGKKNELLTLEKARSRWDLAWEKAIISPEEYKEHSRSVLTRIEFAKNSLAKMQYNLLRIERNKDLLKKKQEFLSNFEVYFDKADLKQRKKALQELIKTITVGDHSHVHIEFILDDVIEGEVITNVNNVNPHPCGYLGDKSRECTCSASQVLRYQKKVSGPLLDRIDIHLDVPAVKVEKLTDHEKSDVENSASIRKRVQQARNHQHERFVHTPITCNAEITSKTLKTYCPLSEACLELLRRAVTSLHLSGRSYHRTIKLARTIADLDNSESITPHHIAEALQYRPRQNII